MPQFSGRAIRRPARRECIMKWRTRALLPQTHGLMMMAIYRIIFTPSSSAGKLSTSRHLSFCAWSLKTMADSGAEGKLSAPLTLCQKPGTTGFHGKANFLLWTTPILRSLGDELSRLLPGNSCEFAAIFTSTRPRDLPGCWSVR